MYLTSTDLAHYLLARGLVTDASVVEGDFFVAEASGRHRNFRVYRHRHKSLFIKQVRGAELGPQESLRHEADCYRRLSSDARLAAIQELVPMFLDYDPLRHTLTVEMLEGTEDLRDRCRRQHGLTGDVAAMLGCALAACHREGQSLAGEPQAISFPGTPPRILSFHRDPTPLEPSDRSNGKRLLQMILADPLLVAALDSLHDDWRRETLIHGDMKLENCLVMVGAAVCRGVHFVDWELADLGDAAWDIAGVWHSCLVWMSADPGRAWPPPELPVVARAVWSSYLAARAEVDPDELLNRCSLCTGARLLQAAMEFARAAGSWDERALGLFRVGHGFLLHPDRAARDILGLPAP